MCSSRLRPLVAAAFAFTTYAGTAAAGTFTLLYTFPDANTGSPTGRLYLGDDILYGTGSGLNSEHGNGQVFQLKKSGDKWKFQTLLAFDGQNGADPRGGVIADQAGTFYGTTEIGGANGSGTVFKLWNAGGRWKSTTLQNFVWDDAGGADPDTDLVFDQSGALVGTTVVGGENQGGTVFSLVPRGRRWKEKVLHRFDSNYDGYEPASGLLLASDGAFYGTTYHGGMYDYGTVYQLARSGSKWTETKIHTFTAGKDGEYPINGLVEGADGTLYGTTLFGGSFQYGTVFSLKQSGGTWTHTVLHEFGQGDDGQEPYGGLVRVGDTLYGTVEFGGTTGAGIIFSLTESGGTWTENILYNFNGGRDGALPCASLIADANGNLYGTTFQGGAKDQGTVWEFTP
ncbi:MAG TPA: choice-of-anchor tandem repeat GloVer-containing protein [Rhizomicrobium sp.]|nr:choice-of-anchor tandem repeat GloVer-containing protein [Rhizomicrobium sp.]